MAEGRYLAWQKGGGVKCSAWWCALAAVLACTAQSAPAQTPPPFYISGPARSARNRVSGRAGRAAERRHAAARRDFSGIDREFKAHDSGGRIIILIGMRQDGQGEVHIPPTIDIDPDLRAALGAFARGVTIKAPLPGCPRWAALVIVTFDANDGTVRTVQTLNPPPRPFPPGIPLPSPSPAKTN